MERFSCSIEGTPELGICDEMSADDTHVGVEIPFSLIAVV
jgi:hypothetical protein